MTGRYNTYRPVLYNGHFRRSFINQKLIACVDHSWSITHTHGFIRLIEPDFLIDNFLKQQFGMDSTRNLFVILPA